jgi:hypothetical protein
VAAEHNLLLAERSETPVHTINEEHKRVEEVETVFALPPSLILLGYFSHLPHIYKFANLFSQAHYKPSYYLTLDHHHLCFFYRL